MNGMESEKSHPISSPYPFTNPSLLSHSREWRWGEGLVREGKGMSIRNLLFLSQMRGKETAFGVGSEWVGGQILYLPLSPFLYLIHWPLQLTFPYTSVPHPTCKSWKVRELTEDREGMRGRGWQPWDGCVRDKWVSPVRSFLCFRGIECRVRTGREKKYKKRKVLLSFLAVNG